MFLWRKCCSLFSLCVLTDHHQNARIQYVNIFGVEVYSNAITANARAQLLTVPPYAVSVVVLCITSYMSDRMQSRGLLVAFSSALGAVGYMLLLAVQENIHVRYFATFCITSGTYTLIGIIIAWCTCAIFCTSRGRLSHLSQFRTTWVPRRSGRLALRCTWQSDSVGAYSERTYSLRQTVRNISEASLSRAHWSSSVHWRR